MSNNRKSTEISRDIIGNYRKRQVTIWTAENGQARIRTNPEASGGTRDHYTWMWYNGVRWVTIGLDKAGQATTACRQDGVEMIHFGTPLLDVILDDDCICVVTGTFCGRTATMRIHGSAWATDRLTRKGQ